MKREIITCDECNNECSEDYYTVFRTGWDGIVSCKRDICKKCFSKMYEALQSRGAGDRENRTTTK